MKRILCAVLCAALLCASLLLPATAALDATAQSLLNSSSLTPLHTGFSPLDQLVQSIFSSRISAGMSTYDKIKFCYDYVNTGASYSGVSPSSSTYNAIRSECGYYKSDDMYLAARAFHFLKDKVGSCIDFADAFMVLARAVGVECYVMHGTYDSGAHYWNLIKLSGDYYIFDAEADWRSAGSSWYNPKYNSFCLRESADSHRSCNRSACIAEFGNFRCQNKTNNPGAMTPGNPGSVTPGTPAASVYTVGVYRTNELMNFRSGHSTSAGSYMQIPGGTTVTVTEIYVDRSADEILYWGKTSYGGKTGWIALNWSTMVSGAANPSTAVPGNVQQPTPQQSQQQTPQKTQQNPQTVGNPAPQTTAATPNDPNTFYPIGAYTTRQTMNFRSGPYTGASIYSEIPVGVTLIVTEVAGDWGKTTYQGETGWMLLQYSTHNEAGQVTVMIPGDADADGEITAEDARLILRHCVSLERLSSELLFMADADGNGEISPEDARLTLRKSVHLD